MTSFFEKLVAEIVISLCVGAVLGLLSGVSWTPGDAVGRNRRPARGHGGADGMIAGEPDQGCTCGEHR